MADTTKKRIPTYPRCPQCGKQFLYREEVTEHLAAVHEYTAPVAAVTAVSPTEYADLKKENAALKTELQELAALVKGTSKVSKDASGSDPVDTTIGTETNS